MRFGLEAMTNRGDTASTAQEAESVVVLEVRGVVRTDTDVAAMSGSSAWVGWASASADPGGEVRSCADYAPSQAGRRVSR